MKLIKDLGMKEYGFQGLRKKMCLYECPKCLNFFEASGWGWECKRKYEDRYEPKATT